MRFCAAVGSYLSDRTGYPVPYLATLHGTTWSAVAAPLPSGELGASLGEISCWSAGRCVAVGGYGSGPGSPLVEVLVDGAWTVVDPLGVSGVLTHVACNAEECLAVGVTNASALSGPLFVDRVGTRWNARALRSSTTASPPTGSGLTCRPRSSARARGPPARTLANGVWTATTITDHAGRLGFGQADLDCPTTAFCAGVSTETFETAQPEAALLTWSNGAWTRRLAAAPSDARAKPDLTLAAVSCTSTRSCAAAGGYAARHRGPVAARSTRS